MPALTFGDFFVHCEAPEAPRYRAAILVLPGLFQSFACWRPITAMLAHRGWEVYCLTRTMPDRSGKPHLLDETWEQARARIAQVGARLGGPVVVLASDLGAALALSVAGQLPILALALFSPSDPAALGAAYRRSLRPSGLRGALSGLRRRASTSRGAQVIAHAALLGPDIGDEDTLPEPARLLGELSEGEGFVRPDRHPPALVFASRSDPLVAEQHALGFADGACAKASRTRLDGRFFPHTGGAVLADEVQRFLILTLGDRVVDFPQDILEE
ncbi:MAG: alpha/beta fold hydrolase [Deltaproteobacteria bacterium]|nr:alpha/beta fold hydrolase [Deltaproteobacteria bacterium]